MEQIRREQRGTEAKKWSRVGPAHHGFVDEIYGVPASVLFAHLVQHISKLQDLLVAWDDEQRSRFDSLVGDAVLEKSESSESSA